MSRFDRVRFGIYRKIGFNLRKRQSLRRTVGYGTDAVARRLRSALGRDQYLDIRGHTLVLPPEHRLPYYCRRDPNYDVYAAELLAAIAAVAGVVRMVDVGANVGDTAVTALTAADNIEVHSVEGNPSFTAYARRNLAPFGDRSTLREAFVGPIRGVATEYASHSGTGGFQRDATDSATGTVAWVAPGELLADLEKSATAADTPATDPGDVAIWKSDIDGFDIHVLAEHWDAIASVCEVVWFEYDPVETLGDRADIDTLAEAIGGSGRGLIVFDNVGDRLVAVPPGDDVAGTLADLTGWLFTQRTHNVTTRYFDLWVVSERVWPTVATVGSNPVRDRAFSLRSPT